MSRPTYALNSTRHFGDTLRISVEFNDVRKMIFTYAKNILRRYRVHGVEKIANDCFFMEKEFWGSWEIASYMSEVGIGILWYILILGVERLPRLSIARGFTQIHKKKHCCHSVNEQ